MKKITFIITVLLFTCLGFAQEEVTEVEEQITDNLAMTSYYLIRHAEKDRSDPQNKDPHLTQQGLLRAAKWSYVFGHVKFDTIYSTDYNRTRETALPTAEKHGITDLTIYDPRSMDMKGFVENTSGKTILIVGHSNTTPELVNKLIGGNKYQQIDDSNNANLYIITITATGEKIDQLLVID